MPESSSSNAVPNQVDERLTKLRTLVDELCAQAPQSLEEAKEQGSRLLAMGKQKVTQAGKAIADTVRKHPSETVIVAVAAGLATWWLLSRHRT